MRMQQPTNSLADTNVTCDKQGICKRRIVFALIVENELKTTEEHEIIGDSLILE